MSSNDIIYRHTFNVLAELLIYGNVINTYCCDKDACERTLERIKSVVETMSKQLEKMEN